MVPRAPNILLALLAIIVSADDLQQLPRGPYRLPKPYERRAALYPTGTRPTSRASGGLQDASQRSPPVQSDDIGSDGYAVPSSRTPAVSATNRTGSFTAGITSIPDYTSRLNTSDELGAHSSPAIIQACCPCDVYNKSVPTKVVVYETSVVLSNSSYTGPTVTYAPEIGTANETRNETTPVSNSLVPYGSGIGTAAPVDYTVPSSWIPSTTNGSVLIYPTSPLGSTLSSEDSALATKKAEVTGNLAGAGPSPLFNTPPPKFCSGATLNIKNASLDYWYPKTYTHVDSTFLIKFDENDTSTGWTLLPATQPFNVTSAIENPGCESSTSTFRSQADQTQTVVQYSCSDTPTPRALVTTTVEQTAYKPIETTSSNGDIPDVVTTPTPAAITVSSDGGASTTYSAGRGSIVHFSQYEIVSKSSYRHWNGTVACIESTELYDLPEPASFEYDGGIAANDSVAEGKLGKRNAAILQALGDANIQLPYGVALGTFVAEPTVVVVVKKVVAAEASLNQQVLAPAASLITPTATLPPGLSLVQTTPTQAGTIQVPLTVHVMTSESALKVPSKTTERVPQGASGSGVTVNGGDINSVSDVGDGFVIVPFVAHLEGSDVTLAISVRPTQSIVTAQFNGQLVTATRTPGYIPADAASVDVGRVVSAIDSAASLTNALQILSKAQATFTTDTGSSNNPTLIIGNSVYVATREEDGIIIDGQLLRPGGPAVTVAGQAVALNSGATAVIIGGNVIDIGLSSSADRPLFTVGTSVLSATRIDEGVIIGGQTLSAGASAVIEGSMVSLDAAGTRLTLGGSTVNIAGQEDVGAAANIPVLTVGTKTITANAATQYNVDGSILTDGGSVVVSGTTLSLSLGATNLLVNGKTQDLVAPAITPAPLLTIGNKVYKPNLGSTYYIDSSMLIPGGQVIVSGTTISLPASGQSVIMNGIARSIGTARSSAKDLTTITALPVLVLDGKMLTPDGGNRYIFSGQTLSPGGAITIDGALGLETLSLNSEADELVTFASGNTFSSYVGMVGAAPGGAPILTIDGKLYSALEYNAGSGATYIIEGSVLTPGGVVTVHGETISLLRAGTAIVVGSSGTTTTSTIEDAYGVAPTNAPILTIGGERFSAINDGATYLVDGAILAPGAVNAVTISGHTYIVSLSPHATILEIVEIGANGQAMSTVFETLFPATATPATITSTSFMNGVAATGGATLPSASLTGQLMDFEGGSPASFCTKLSGTVITLISFTLGFWL